MFAKRLLKKAMSKDHHHHHHHHQKSPPERGLKSSDFEMQIALHYGIPTTSSVLAFDPVQRLLAIGTLDGRVKIIGGGNIEGLLLSPKRLPFKNLEFLCNQGFLVGVSNENDIQVWDLEHRKLACSLQWENTITAFSTIRETCLMYVGDEEGSISVLKYAAKEGELVRLPYHITSKSLSEKADISLPSHQSVVGILPQPSSSGSRVLIAHVNGVIILWDVFEDQVVTLRGCSNLYLKGDAAADDSSNVVHGEDQDDTADCDQEDKEICSLCWVSNSGSILAVGYLDGDILLWDISSNFVKSRQDRSHRTPSKDVIKLQLSSEGRRLPVIVLHWSPDIKTDDGCKGKLFVYGGDQIGSDEVLTVLSLDWSAGIESICCVARVDLTLNGSFADMILIPKSGITEDSSTDAVFVLTNPGQLHVYDGSTLSNLNSKGETPFMAESFPLTVPTIDPSITVSKHYIMPIDGDYLKVLLEEATSRYGATYAGIKWSLTGGIPCKLPFAEGLGFERIFVAGYQDGSVRIWDVTNPIMTLLYTFEGEIKDFKMPGGCSSVSALDFFPNYLLLAVGCVSGLIRIYKLHDSSKESTVHLLSEGKQEVHVVHHGEKSENAHLVAAFSVSKSPIQALQFVCSGARLAVGFKCGQVVVLDVNAAAVLFSFDYPSKGSEQHSEIISFATKVIPYVATNKPELQCQENPDDSTKEKELLLILTKDSHVIVVDSLTGEMISPKPTNPLNECTAVSMHVIDRKMAEHLAKNDPLKNEPEVRNQSSGNKSGFQEIPASDTSSSGSTSVDSILVLCCENVLWLYSLDSVIQGDNSYIRKESLPKSCCWSSIFKLKEEEAYGVLLLYQTGVLEIRSFPNLEMLGESSLMSILRWSFKLNMHRTLSSTYNGEISLVNGCEMAFISFLVFGNDFRIPESLPCLHDEVLAAAAAAAISFSAIDKKKKDGTPGVLGGIIKGLKGGNKQQTDSVTANMPESSSMQLEEFFSRVSLSNSLVTTGEEDDEDLSIDDIEIDDPLPVNPVIPSSHLNNKQKQKDDKKEREKLFEGSTVDTKPRLRSQQEILTKYKFGGDASAAAAHARDKLVQRQEKLQRMSERTEELQNRAEDFKSMADELVRTMENKKWWKL